MDIYPSRSLSLRHYSVDWVTIGPINQKRQKWEQQRSNSVAPVELKDAN